MRTVIFCFIIVVILLLIYWLRTPKYNFDDKIALGNIKYLDFVSPLLGNRGPRVGFLGSVHGNEPAGNAALNYLIKTGWFDRYLRGRSGLIRVISDGNVWGLKYGLRYQNNLLHPDINRNFYAGTRDQTSQNIMHLFADMDLVVDFHEGWGFHLINPESLGSTISPGNTDVSKNIAKNMMQINNYIDDADKKFITLNNHSCTIPTTLACFMQRRNRNYILIETSGQGDIQPLTTRMQQDILFVKTALDYMFHH